MQQLKLNLHFCCVCQATQCGARALHWISTNEKFQTSVYMRNYHICICIMSVCGNANTRYLSKQYSSYRFGGMSQVKIEYIVIIWRGTWMLFQAMLLARHSYLLPISLTVSLSISFIILSSFCLCFSFYRCVLPALCGYWIIISVNWFCFCVGISISDTKRGAQWKSHRKTTFGKLLNEQQKNENCRWHPLKCAL